MNHAIPASPSELLQEIRIRLQQAHFATRGMPCAEAHEPEPLVDQLHTIRVLAEELADSLEARLRG